MQGVTFEIAETAGAKEYSGNEEECGHAHGAEGFHSQVYAFEGLLHMKKADQQKDESLVFVNPLNSLCCVKFH